MKDTFEQEPKLIPTYKAEDPERERISFIDAQIHQNPGEFAEALTQLKDKATIDSQSIHEARSEITSLNTDPVTLIIEFFRDRYDWLTTYDGATEDYMDSDETYRNLLAAATSKTTTQVRIGKMSSASIETEAAKEARDNLRRHSLGLYLARVVQYQKDITDLAAS